MQRLAHDQTLGIKRTISLARPSYVYRVQFYVAAIPGFDAEYSEIRHHIWSDGVGGGVAGTGTSSGNDLYWNDVAFDWVGSGSPQVLSIVAEPCAVSAGRSWRVHRPHHATGAAAQHGAGGRADPAAAARRWPRGRGWLGDRTLVAEDIPVGATVTDNQGSSFTATAGNRSVEVTTWPGWIYSIESPTLGTFDLKMRTRSTEAVTGEWKRRVLTMTVHVVDEMSPIILDLNGDGVQTVSLDESRATFDLMNTGYAVRSSWVSPEDGFLAIDSTDNGIIDNRNELFGGAVGAGFAKLATFDTNGDGVVDARDASFSELLIWQDRSGNHATDAGELVSVASTDIRVLNTSCHRRGGRAERKPVAGEELRDSRGRLDQLAMADAYFKVASGNPKVPVASAACSGNHGAIGAAAVAVQRGARRRHPLDAHAADAEAGRHCDGRSDER